MATYDAELLSPPGSIEADKATRDAEVVLEAVQLTPTRVEVDARQGIVRRSKR